MLAELCADPAVIAYRQDVLDDMLRLSELAAGCATLLPQLAELARKPRRRQPLERPNRAGAGRRAPGRARRLCHLRRWAGGCTRRAARSLRSAGLQALHDFLAAIRATPDYQRLAGELPHLRAQLEQAGSVTLGINLDGQLRPESATVLAINPYRVVAKAACSGACLASGPQPTRYAALLRCSRPVTIASTPPSTSYSAI